MKTYDIAEIASMLASRAEDVCRWLLPNGVREGHEWCCGNLSGATGRSLKVNLAGKAGVWRDFADSGKGGDLVDLIQAVCGVDKAGAVATAKEWLGIRDSTPKFTAVKKNYARPKPWRGERPADEGLLAYFKSRSLSDRTVAAFGVTMFDDPNRGPVIVFPSYRDNELVRQKFRPVADKRGMWTSKDSEPCLFGWQTIPGNSRSVVLVEGECFRGDAEIFTSDGWVNFADVKGCKSVLQVHEDFSASFVEPLAIVEREYHGDLLHLHNTQRFSSLTTPKHNMAVISPKGKVGKRHADELKTQDAIPRVIKLDGEGCGLTQDQIALHIAISADSKIDKRKTCADYVHFAFTKERKIKRLAALLGRLGIKYTSYIGVNGYTSFNFLVPTWMKCKKLPDYWLTAMTLEERKFVIEEMVEWDGNHVPNRKQYEFSSCKYEEAKWMQTMAHTCGYTSTIMSRSNQFGDWFKVSILLNKTKTFCQYSLKSDNIHHDGMVYCVTVPSGMILVRVDGCIYVCGNCDAMAMFEAGFPALSVPMGGGAGEKQDGWIDAEWERMQLFDRIYLALDADEEGVSAAKHIARRLGQHRCFFVDFEGHKDANDALLAGADIKAMVEKATTVDPDELRPANSYLPEVFSFFESGGESRAGQILPWDKTAETIRVRPGEISVWAGTNGHGKSQVVGHLAVDSIARGERWCIASMEFKPYRLLARLCRQAAGTNQPKAISDGPRIEKLLADRLWIFDVQGTAKAERVLEVFEYALKRYGVKNFVVDSLAKCGFGEDAYNEQKDFVDKLGDFARNNDVHVHLVCHARKGKDESEVPDKFDVKGTGALTDMVDNIFIVWRNKPKEEKLRNTRSDFERANLQKTPDAIVECCKQRNGEWEGKVKLWFEPASLQYLESFGIGPKRYAV